MTGKNSEKERLQFLARVVEGEAINLTNTIRSIASFSLSLGDCRRVARRRREVCSRAYIERLVITIAVHTRREESPAGAPDESACGVKVTRRRTTMPSPPCLAGESVRSPECGNTSDCISKATDSRLFARPFTAETAACLDEDQEMSERVDAFVARFSRFQPGLCTTRSSRGVVRLCRWGVSRPSAPEAYSPVR